MPSSFGNQFNKVVRAQRVSTEGNTVVAAVGLRNDYNQQLLVTGIEASLSAEILADIGNRATMLVYAREYPPGLSPNDNHSTLFATTDFNLLIQEAVINNFHSISRRFDQPLALIQPTTYVFAVFFINQGNPPPATPADDWELRLEVFGTQITNRPEDEQRVTLKLR